MESIIRYQTERQESPLVLSEAIKAGCQLSKSSLVNYILTNNTNAVFPVVAAEPVLPVYPGEVFDRYRESLPTESEANIEVLFNRLLLENIEASSKFKQKALLLSGGIDSILVAGILAKCFGTENLRFYHMRHGSFTEGETERARSVAKSLGVKIIEINKGPFVPDDYIEPIKVNGHSVDLSAPSYLEVCRQIKEEQGSEVDVFNGELNLIDVGFSESSDPTRSLRRFIFSHLRVFDTLSSIGWKSIPSLPQKNKYFAVLNEIASMIFRKSNKEQFIAGFYTGKAHFPGFAGWENACGIDHQNEIERFLNRLNYKYQADFKRFLYQTAPAFYSGTTNVETVGSFIKNSGMNYVMPYSSAELAALSLSLPSGLARDKRIQKNLSVGKYGIDRKVAYYLKNHAGYNQAYRDHFDTDAFKETANSEKFQLCIDNCREILSGLSLNEAANELQRSGVVDQKTLRLFVAVTSIENHRYA
jgi:NAD synthase